MSDYVGDWMILKFPRPIKLTKYVFVVRENTYFYRMPGLWKIYGSNDGINWTAIQSASNTTTKIIQTMYSSNGGTYMMNNINSSSYLYYGMTVNQLSGVGDCINFMHGKYTE